MIDTILVLVLVAIMCYVINKIENKAYLIGIGLVFLLSPLNPQFLAGGRIIVIVPLFAILKAVFKIEKERKAQKNNITKVE